MLPAYPKVQNLGPRVVIYPDKEYYVEEKVDGSQFSFGLVDRVLMCRSKGVHIDVAAPPAMFAPAVYTATLLVSRLIPDVVYRAEALWRPKHNALTYGRVPEGGLVLFDIEPVGGTPFTRLGKELEAARLGLEVVPVLYRGQLTMDTFTDLMDYTSFLGGPKIEGVVIKSDEPEYVVYGGQEIRLVMKYVSEAFKEFNKKNWKVENPDRRDAIAVVTAQLRTEARWAKAVQHLRDEGRLTGTVRDIGPLIGEVQRDIFDGDADEVGRLLLEAFKPILKKTSAAGLAEWYKQSLVAEALDG